MKCSRRCDWNACEGKEYFSYGEIVYCRHQILWIIENRHTLKKGEWVATPEHIDKVQRSRSKEAPYEKALRVIGDVESRLDKCMPDRKELCFSAVDLMASQGGTYKDLSPNVKDIINYISGWWSKADVFTHWRSNRDYRNRKKVDKTYRQIP